MVVLCHPGQYRPYEGQDPQGPSRYPPRVEPVFPLNPSHSSPPTRAHWQWESNLDWLDRANEPYQLSQALVDFLHNLQCDAQHRSDKTFIFLPQLPCNNFYYLNFLVRATSKNDKSHLCHCLTLCLMGLAMTLCLDINCG